MDSSSGMEIETIPIPWWYLQHQKILKYSTKSASWFPESTDMGKMPFHLQYSKYYPEWGCYTKEEAMLTLRQLARTIPGHEPEEDIPEMLSHMSDLLQQYFELDVDNVTEVILQLCRSPRLTLYVMNLFPDSQFEQLVFVVEHLSATASLPKWLFEKKCLPHALPLLLMNSPSKLSLLIFHGVPCEIPEWMDEIFRIALLNEDPSKFIIESSRQRTAVFFYILYDIATSSRKHQEVHRYAEIEELLHTWRLCDPQPIITPKELKVFVAPLLPSYEFKDYMHLDMIWMLYYQTFTNIKIKEPRQLQHLCRCVVRRRLFDNGCLIFGVESLKIPKAMKDYLLLRKIEHTGVARERPSRKRKLS